MAKSIVGLFDEMEEAQAVVQDLVNRGFPRENISVVANNARNQSMMNSGVVTGTDEKQGQAGDTASSAGTGAGIGAVLGGVAGLLVGLGALTIPGIGPVVAAGPLMAALGGAGVGAVTGGVIGALVDAGVSDSDAKIYAEGVRRGGTLMLVYTGDDQADWVMDLMNQHHPVDIQERATQWQGQDWTGFNENNETYAFDRDPDRSEPARMPQSTLDYGPGARAYMAGRPVEQVDRGSANLGNYQNVTGETWLMYESRFREHYRDNYADRPDARWEDFRDSYRFGFDMGHLPSYSNLDWNQVSDQLRQRWEQEFNGLNWDNYQHAVHDGFEAGHVPQ